MPQVRRLLEEFSSLTFSTGEVNVISIEQWFCYIVAMKNASSHVFINEVSAVKFLTEALCVNSVLSPMTSLNLCAEVRTCPQKL